MKKKLKRYKVGVDSETYAISLVESPAVEEMLVALESEEPMKLQFNDDYKHIVYSAALVPNKPIYRRLEDGTEFYVEFTEESIEKMSQKFIKDYRNVTIDHQEDANDISVVESWIKTDLYKDKSVAIGLSEQLPIGTWILGLKVNEIDTWERIMKGELQGFSVEALIQLEEFDFNKQDNNEEKMDEMRFLTMMKEALQEVLEVFSMRKEKEEIARNSGFTSVEEFEKEAEIIMQELEEQAPIAEPTPTEPIAEPTVEPTVAKEEVVEETVEEPNIVDEPTTVVEDVKPKEDVSHLEELIKNLKSEIESLKEMNGNLRDKVDDLGKQPSAKPINTNGKGVGKGDAYEQWREIMRSSL